MYAIKISYSWGDEEPLYGKFQTAEEAYKEMCLVASKEAFTQNEEFEEDHTCQVSFDAYKKKIVLHYNVDDEYCYYQIVYVKGCKQV